MHGFRANRLLVVAALLMLAACGVDQGTNPDGSKDVAFEGRLVGAKGEGIAGADIRLRPHLGNPRHGTTDGNGNFRIKIDGSLAWWKNAINGSNPIWFEANGQMVVVDSFAVKNDSMGIFGLRLRTLGDSLSRLVAKTPFKGRLASGGGGERVVAKWSVPIQEGKGFVFSFEGADSTISDATALFQVGVPVMLQLGVQPTGIVMITDGVVRTDHWRIDAASAEARLRWPLKTVDANAVDQVKGCWQHETAATSTFVFECLTAISGDAQRLRLHRHIQVKGVITREDSGVVQVAWPKVSGSWTSLGPNAVSRTTGSATWNLARIEDSISVRALLMRGHPVDTGYYVPYATSSSSSGTLPWYFFLDPDAPSGGSSGGGHDWD